jgi:hypothetical protein
MLWPKVEKPSENVMESELWKTSATPNAAD